MPLRWLKFFSTLSTCSSFSVFSLTYLLQVANLSLYAVAFLVFNINTKGSIIDVENQVCKILVCFVVFLEFPLEVFLILFKLFSIAGLHMHQSSLGVVSSVYFILEQQSQGW